MSNSLRLVTVQHALLELQVADGRERRRRRNRRTSWIRRGVVGVAGGAVVCAVATRAMHTSATSSHARSVRLMDEVATLSVRASRSRRTGSIASAMRWYASTSGCRPSGDPDNRSRSPAAATAARVSTNRIRGSRAASAGDPRVDGVHRVVLRPGGRVVRQDRSGDDRNLLGRGAVEHRAQLSGHGRGRLALIDVVHAGDDHDGGRPCADDVAIEARGDLIASLAVDAPIEHPPVRMPRHQPVRVLTALVTAAVGRRLERRFEERRAGRRRVPEGDDDDRRHVQWTDLLVLPWSRAAVPSTSRITRRMLRFVIFRMSSSL